MRKSLLAVVGLTAMMLATPSFAAKETQADLQKEAKISMKKARSIALKKVPNGKIASSELERENGKLIYSFDIKQSGQTGITEVAVDAINGDVVDVHHETPAKEAAEIAKIDGLVEFGGTVRGKRRLILRDPVTGQEEEHLIPLNKHIIVFKGDFVKKGSQLTEGPIVPHEILEVCGPQDLQEHLRDLYADLSGGQVPGIRRVDELVVS